MTCWNGLSERPQRAWHLASAQRCRAATAKKAAVLWSMTSSSLSDSSTCAERTLNVTGPRRNALIKLREHRATGNHLQEEAFFAGVFIQSHTHCLTRVWWHKDTAPCSDSLSNAYEHIDHPHTHLLYSVGSRSRSSSTAGTSKCWLSGWGGFLRGFTASP